jgi:2-methylcitrate dehydratase PrpD
MTGATARLAEFAATLQDSAIPPHVLLRAKDCVIDTVAVVTQGASLPWSQIVIRYAQSVGAGGAARVLGVEGPSLHAAAAALANGTLAHAFEADNLTRPSAGVHPGGTLLPPALAVAQEIGASGRDLLRAVVAGFEVMVRIGRATKHSNEHRGFHAPGTTGPFGAAVAAGVLLGLDTERMINAMGIAGSMAGGLMEFARSGTGAMVKRLHLGRAAEAGVVAARLAADGFTGPVSVLEGKAGFLNVFCEDTDPAALTRDLGTDWLTMALCLKRFPVHMTAQTGVQAVLELKAEHGFSAADVASITVAGTERMATINNIPRPADVMMAQYSIPFCVALAMVRDPRDPASFDDGALTDPAITSLLARTSVIVADPPPDVAGASIVTIQLRDGRFVTKEVRDFNGTPARPLDRAELHDKFTILTRAHHGDAATALFERLWRLEAETNLDWIGARVGG